MKVESAAAAGVVYAVLATISMEILRRVPDTDAQAGDSREPRHHGNYFFAVLLIGHVEHRGC